MSLEKRVMEAMKIAMKEKKQAQLTGLRAIKSAILLAKTEKGFSGELTEAKEIAILQKMVKQRKESLKIYEEQNRADLAEKEQVEIEVVEQFLPEQMSEDEIKNTLQNIIAQTGASSMKDMGKVMGMATKTFAGKADNSLVSTIVKALLS